MTWPDIFELWQALGCPLDQFDAWQNQPSITKADAVAQIHAAISGNVKSLCQDSHPPAHPALVDAARLRIRLQPA